ncbi:hypothetical protein VTJ49DRAFT_2211 [Mycothermus thermophilus]|uniref:TPX2 C-terminal domain-containing protein n=1 Tax=Humicola insolens TaxID=85995 RepID=A0ABR3VAN2_HUMIN
MVVAAPRVRPCVDHHPSDFIHDDNSHKPQLSGTSTTTTTALGELPLNNVYAIKPRNSSLESLTRRLDDFHLCDKENRPSASDVVERASSQDRSTTPRVVTDAWEETNPLAQASRQLPSTQEQLAKHQQGQFEWLLSIPVPPKRAASADPDVRGGNQPRSARERADAAGGPGEGGETLYFGCNLVCRRRSRSASGDVEACDHGNDQDNDSDRPANVYTLLATRISSANEFGMVMDSEIEKLKKLQEQEQMGDAIENLEAPASIASGDERSRPVSRIEDSVEALDRLEEEIEALREATQISAVLSPEAVAKKGKDVGSSSKTTTPVRRAASVRVGPASGSARGKLLERSSSVRKAPASSAEDNGETSVPGSASSSARRVPRPASLLPPKPLAKSNKAPTVPTFELPGEAVARKLKEQREKRMSQISSEQSNPPALAAHFTPSKPHFKSAKPPTVPQFELPGEAISRRKREQREAKLRAQEEEERRQREFKARPIRASLAAPSTLPRENLASLARRAAASGDGSADSSGTTITPSGSQSKASAAGSSSKRQSMIASASPTPTSAKSATLPMRGRPGTAASMATTTSGASTRSSPQAGLNGKEVLARDNALRMERERERRERENAAKAARQEAAEWSREQSRRWAEKQRAKKEKEKRERDKVVQAEAGTQEAGVVA